MIFYTPQRPLHVLKRILISFCVILVGIFSWFSWALYESSNERMNQKATKNQFDNAEAREMLRAASEMARLAPLPMSHKDFKIYTYGNMFTRSFLFYFQASESDIEKFISKSEGIILDQPDQVYSFEFPGICFDSLEERNKFEAMENGQRLKDFCVLDEQWPEWWSPEITESGRKFTIYRIKDYEVGEMYVNDKTGQVYISVAWS